MTYQRLTILPQPDAVLPTSSPTALPQARRGSVDVQSIARMGKGDAWRTEAMRSYDRPVLMWFTRGQGRLTIAGRTCGYSPHNMVFLPAKTMHGFSTMGPALGSVVFLPEGSEFNWPDAPLHLRFSDVRTQRELTAIIETMAEEVQRDGESSAKALLCHAALLSIWLSRAIESTLEQPFSSPGTRLDTAAHRLAEAYTALVERDFRRPKGVQHYASLLGVTPTHLSRVCRKIAGRPALDILADRRHFEARRLLKDTKLKVARIAEQTGFASAAYFTRSFRSRTGQSPSEFRFSH